MKESIIWGVTATLVLAVSAVVGAACLGVLFGIVWRVTAMVVG